MGLLCLPCLYYAPMRPSLSSGFFEILLRTGRPCAPCDDLYGARWSPTFGRYMDSRVLPSGQAASVKAETQPASEVAPRARRGSAGALGGYTYSRTANPDWQAVVRSGLRDVDILHAAVDATASEVARTPLFLQMWDADRCDWVRVTKDTTQASTEVRDAYSRVIRLMTPTFKHRLWYSLESVGESYIIVDLEDTPKDTLKAFYHAQVTALTWPGEKDSDRRIRWNRYSEGSANTAERRIKEDNLSRVFVPDMEHDLDAWSPYRALCTTIEQFQLAMDLIHASLGEKLYTSPILWFPIGDDDDESFEAYKKNNQQLMANANVQQGGPLRRNAKVSRSPWAVSTEVEPKYITIGGDINDEPIRLIEMMTGQIARASSQPTDVLLQGRSAANHWGSLHTAKNHLTFTIGQRADTMAAAITASLFTPFLDDSDKGVYRIGADVDRLVNMQVNPAEVRQAYLTGAIPLACVAESVGKEPMVLPEGVTERDHWATVTKSQVVRADTRLGSEGDSGESRDVGAVIGDGDPTDSVDGPGSGLIVARGRRVGGQVSASGIEDDSYLIRGK